MAGRLPYWIAVQLNPKAAVSLSMWPASASSASEPETMPPTISTTMNIAMTTKAQPMRR